MCEPWPLLGLPAYLLWPWPGSRARRTAVRERQDRDSEQKKKGPACMMHVRSILRQIDLLRQKDLWITHGVIEACVCARSTFKQ